MSSVNHEERCLLGILDKSHKYVFKDSHFAPSDKTIIKSLIRAVFFGSILLLKATLRIPLEQEKKRLMYPSGQMKDKKE